MQRARTVAAPLAALAAALGLAACGGGGDTESVSGNIEPVASAPAAYSGVSGEATLERSGGSTQATLEVTGLEPETQYVAHLHAAGCDQADPGGPHFKFDPNGPDIPPNEIHFAFSSNADGKGEASASNDREVPVGEAGSVVVHLAEPEEAMEGRGEMGHGERGGHSHSHAGKIACAELEGGSAASAEGEGASGGGGSGGEIKTIVIEGGEPVGGVQELEYSAGEQIRFEVESDVADEVHVHGYDLMKDVPAGGSVSYSFPAEIEGIFEVELEGRKEQIAELRVNP